MSNLSPLLQQIIGGLVRFSLGGVIAWMIQKGIIEESQRELVLAGCVTAFGTVAWIIGNKIKDLRVLNTALAAEPGMTQEEVKAIVKAGRYASSLTPKSEPPRIIANR